MKVSYRKSLEAKGWHRPWPIRIVAVGVGFGLFFVGAVLWALETEYGGDRERHEYVIGWDEILGGAVVLGENNAIVYEATDISDAEAWVEAQRGSRNYTVPILLFVVGAAGILVGIAPSPRRSGDDGEVPPGTSAVGEVEASVSR